jgi:hypothetical protein
MLVCKGEEGRMIMPLSAPLVYKVVGSFCPGITNQRRTEQPAQARPPSQNFLFGLSL